MTYTILIVEDTLAVREEIYDILIMEGYNVFQAQNGIDGYDMAFKENPDLIISDILMPELNGFEMFDKLQKESKTMHIPLIFLSAKGEKEDVRYGMNLGAEDYLTKPINVNDLVSAVENKINKKLIIDKTTSLNNNYKHQKPQIDTFSNLVLDEVKYSQNKILELLEWTKKEFEETNNFEVSIIKIDKKWSKLGYVKYKSINTNTIAQLAKEKIHKPSYIKIVIGPELPNIYADAYMLEKVFEILLQNALNHIDSKIGLIKLNCETLKKEYIFSVKYNYIQISSEYYNNLFEQYQMIKPSKSIGVELNILIKIISHYKGEIYTENTLNKETIFYFKLPKTVNNV
jgi:DNA-binding response OmpR family regulator